MRRRRSNTNVYVIELDKSVLKRRKFLEANPKYIKGMPCLYVGMSSKPPAKRFEQHLNGYRSSRYVKTFLST